MYREINSKSASSGSQSQTSSSRALVNQVVRPIMKKSRQVANNGQPSQRQQQTPQRHPVINISTSVNSLPISNAPTSLANLAQMNGITLLPLSSTSIASQPNQGRASNQRPQASKASPISNQPRPPNAIPYSLANLINQTKQKSNNHRAQDLSVSIPNQTARSNSNQQFNTIANMQSPNDPLSTITERSKISSQSTNASVMINLPSTKGQKSSESTNSARAPSQSANRRQKFFDNLNHNRGNGSTTQQTNDRTPSEACNTMQIFPVNNGSCSSRQHLASSQPTQSTSHGDLSTHSSLRSLVDDSNNDSDGYIDNISLIKLMAIFNNPALTITAVTPPASKSNDESRGPNSVDKRLPDLESKSRLPQSSANIKSVHSVQAVSNAVNHSPRDQQSKINQQIPSRTGSTVSVQLLKHIADQSDENNWTNERQSPRQSKDRDLESDCIVSTVRKSVPQLLNKPAKQVEICKTVISNSYHKKKTPVKPLQTTVTKLYIPRTHNQSNGLKTSMLHDGQLNNDLNDIAIEESGKKESFVSDQHMMLESMMSDENGEKKLNSLSEPDDIFINRSKRVMSLIDTMVERKRRKRFERISGRNVSEAPPDNQVDSQDCTDDEWSSDEGLDYVNFITTQLPLEEIESDEKRNHMSSVGLVSRGYKNKILLDQCEERSKIFTPLVDQEYVEVPIELKRFIDTILKTGGENVQMRIDSNIKRNDLPLIEGLNKNTSRLKMTYMSVLGLEKRSKRTTLYKIEKRPACREIMKPPKKNEYMRSLGLVAS